MSATTEQARESTAVVPVVGEVLDLAALEPNQLGEVLQQAKGYKEAFDAFMVVVGEELHHRMDAEGEYTVHLPGGVKLTGKSPDAHTEYNQEHLQRVLDELIAEELVSSKLAGEAIVAKTEWVVSKTGVNKLLRLGGEVRRRIEECKHPKSSPRRVTVGQEGA